jgi:hypothetical protein
MVCILMLGRYWQIILYNKTYLYSHHHVSMYIFPNPNQHFKFFPTQGVKKMISTWNSMFMIESENERVFVFIQH